MKHNFADGFKDSNGTWHDPEDDDYEQACRDHMADYGDYIYHCAKDDGTLKRRGR